MKEAKTKSKNELLPGTLEMLILKTLSIESMLGRRRAAHPDAVGGRADDRRGIAVSGAAADARQGMGVGRVEDFGEQPASALLHAHDGRGKKRGRCRWPYSTR